MRVALVYDWLNRWGGAERVILSLLKIWPEAKIFTAVYDPEKAKFLGHRPVRTSFLQKFPAAKKHVYWYYPFLGHAFESFSFQGFDLVISLSSGPAKAIITQPDTFHLHYCLTPPRYLWRPDLIPWRRLFPWLAGLRQDDWLFGQRPDAILAISKTVAERAWHYYRRSSEVIYPGINYHRFAVAQKPADKNAPFLVVSRLVEYKRVDLAIEAFNRLGWPLWIVGEGRAQKKLMKKAKKNIKFWGKVNESQLKQLYQQTQALIMPQEEDFGLVSLETQASGRPVIAYDGGGARETVVAGKTGLFFFPATVKALIETLRHFQKWHYQPAACRRQAERFGESHFRREFKKKAEELYKKWKMKSEK